MKNLFSMMKSEDGATAIEYALIAALIAVFAIGALQIVGTQVNTAFSKAGSAMVSANR